jgi:hypothetical protein
MSGVVRVSGCGYFWVYTTDSPAILVNGDESVKLVNGVIYSIVALNKTKSGSWRTSGGMVVRQSVGKPSQIETRLFGKSARKIVISSDSTLTVVDLESPEINPQKKPYGESKLFPSPAYENQEQFARWNIRSCFFPSDEIVGGAALPELGGLVVDNRSFDFWVEASLEISATLPFREYLATAPPTNDPSVLSLAALVVTAPGWTSFWRDDGPETSGNGDTNGNVVGSLGYGDCEDAAAFVVAARAGLGQHLSPSSAIGKYLLGVIRTEFPELLVVVNGYTHHNTATHNPSGKSDPALGHAWVMAVVAGKSTILESTNPYLAFGSSPRFFIQPTEAPSKNADAIIVPVKLVKSIYLSIATEFPVGKPVNILVNNKEESVGIPPGWWPDSPYIRRDKMTTTNDARSRFIVYPPPGWTSPLATGKSSAPSSSSQPKTVLPSAAALSGPLVGITAVGPHPHPRRRQLVGCHIGQS